MSNVLRAGVAILLTSLSTQAIAQQYNCALNGSTPRAVYSSPEALTKSMVRDATKRRPN